MIQHFNNVTEYDIVDIYTDGSCINVGTSNALARSGCYFPQFNVGLSVDVPGGQTNNRGELWAALYSVCFAMKILNNISNEKISKINIYTDSTYVLNCFDNKGKKNLDLVNIFILSNESTRIPFELIKVLGHSNNEGNEMADYLADANMD
jgi:ribonuclease HI